MHAKALQLMKLKKTKEDQDIRKEKNVVSTQSVGLCYFKTVALSTLKRKNVYFFNLFVFISHLKDTF